MTLSVPGYVAKFPDPGYFLRYDPKGTEERLKAAAKAGLPGLSANERSFFLWLADHIQLLHDMNATIDFVTKHCPPEIKPSGYIYFGVAGEANGLSHLIYQQFYRGFKQFGMTPETILAAHRMTGDDFLRMTRELARSLKVRAARLEQAYPGAVKVEVGMQSRDAGGPLEPDLSGPIGGFFHVIFKPHYRLKFPVQMRYYLTVNPATLTTCVNLLYEEIARYAINHNYKIAFKFVVSNEYRKDTLVIYADQELATVLRRFPDEWFLDFSIPFGTRIARGRVMAQDVGQPLKDALFKNTDVSASNGMILSRVFAEALEGYVKANRRMPKTDGERFSVLVTALEGIFAKGIKVQDGLGAAA